MCEGGERRFRQGALALPLTAAMRIRSKLQPNNQTFLSKPNHMKNNWTTLLEPSQSPPWLWRGLKMSGVVEKRAGNKQSLVPIFSLPRLTPADESLSPSFLLSILLSLSLSSYSPILYPDMHHQPDLILGGNGGGYCGHYRRMSYQNRSGQNGEDGERERERAERGRKRDHHNKKRQLRRSPSE